MPEDRRKFATSLNRHALTAHNHQQSSTFSNAWAVAFGLLADTWTAGQDTG